MIMKISKEDVFDFINSPKYQPMILKQIYKHFNVYDKNSKKKIRDIMKELLEERRIYKTPNNRYSAKIPDQIEGKLEFIRSGKMAFVKASDGKEYVVFPESAKDAMHGDVVLIKPEGKYRDWYRGKVIRVIKRNLTRIVGVLVKEGKRYYVIPDE